MVYEEFKPLRHDYKDQLRAMRYLSDIQKLHTHVKLLYSNLDAYFNIIMSKKLDDVIDYLDEKQEDKKLDDLHKAITRFTINYFKIQE